MKVAVVGIRSLGDYNVVKKVLDKYNEHISEIVSGGAKGVDQMAIKWAKDNNKKYTEFYPQYDKHPTRIAPILRNTQIIDHSDKVIAFWNGSSKGTLDSIKKAQKKNKLFLVVPVNNLSKQQQNKIKL